MAKYFDLCGVIMEWFKAFHVISVITWFAALFYLPRLFVYHSMSDDKVSTDRFKVMERKLYRGIMMPSFVIASVLGIWMLQDYAWSAYSQQYWLHTKLFLVILLVIYHFYCGHLIKVFQEDKNTRSDVFYRWFNEFPVLILIAIIILVVVKPF
jgi:putative membrane protein